MVGFQRALGLGGGWGLCKAARNIWGKKTNMRQKRKYMFFRGAYSRELLQGICQASTLAAGASENKVFISLSSFTHYPLLL